MGTFREHVCLKMKLWIFSGVCNIILRMENREKLCVEYVTFKTQKMDICSCKAINLFRCVVFRFIRTVWWHIHVTVYDCTVAYRSPNVTMAKSSVHCNFIVFRDKTFPKVLAMHKKEWVVGKKCALCGFSYS